MNAKESAVKKSLIEDRPELFDGFNGIERSPEQQRQHDEYAAEMMKSMPDYIKQAVAGREKQAQPA